MGKFANETKVIKGEKKRAAVAKSIEIGKIYQSHFKEIILIWGREGRKKLSIVIACLALLWTPLKHSKK